MSLDDIRADFELLEDWEDRYRYVIELGRKLPEMPVGLKTEANKVRGCASQVWLATRLERAVQDGPPKLHFLGDSDAHIVRGLVAILFVIVDSKTPDEILATDPVAEFAALGLREHLTPQRSNGFASMVERIRADARAARTPPLAV
jgi:cysteine desulfuration protein SufE